MGVEKERATTKPTKKKQKENSLGSLLLILMPFTVECFVVTVSTGTFATVGMLLFSVETHGLVFLLMVAVVLLMIRSEKRFLSQ